MALHESTDGGSTWTTTKISTNPGIGYAVAIDPIDENIIYVGGKCFTSQGYQGRLYETLDGGNSWIPIGADIQGIIFDIEINPVTPTKLYVGTQNGIFKSEDSGLSWIQTSYFDVRFIRINPDFTNEILASGYDGIYYSLDSGSTWFPFNASYTVDRIIRADMDHSNGIFYAGTPFGSIYRYKLSELYILTINSGPGGTTDPDPEGYIHDLDTSVPVEAIAIPDWAFSHWSGDAPQGQENNNPVAITINSDKSITANFIQLICTLTINSSHGGTTNPPSGSYRYDADTEVTLNATPDPDYAFLRWVGDVPQEQSTNNPLILTMDSDKNITPSFKSTLVEEGKKMPCFIATAAYGSPYHHSVAILRDFRDRYLSSNTLGRFMVDLYYKHSPFFANTIAKHRYLRIFVRTNLLPLVVFSYSMLHLGPLNTALVLVLMLIIPVLSNRYYQRKLKSKR